MAPGSLSQPKHFFLAFPLVALKVSRLSTVAKWRTLLCLLDRTDDSLRGAFARSRW